MSALEELWLWLQGRSSQTSTTDTMHRTRGRQQQAELSDDPAKAAQKAAETQARVQRNSRYRAGPWQMK